LSSPNPTCPERQYVWGLRYDDDLVLRDRETTQASSVTCLATNERLYALHDFFNTTAVVNTSGTALERYGYDAFGFSRVMDASFGSRANSSYAWETRYGAYHWDSETGLYHVRNRFLHPKLGRWLSRDPVEYRHGTNLYAYGADNPVSSVDSVGLGILNDCVNTYVPEPDRKPIIKCILTCVCDKSSPKAYLDCLKKCLKKVGKEAILDYIFDVLCCVQYWDSGIPPNKNICKSQEPSDCQSCCIFKDCKATFALEDPIKRRNELHCCLVKCGAE